MIYIKRTYNKHANARQNTRKDRQANEYIKQNLQGGSK